MVSVNHVVNMLKLAKSLWDWAKENNLVSKKQDQAVAAASLRVLESTETGHLLLEKISALPEEEADKLWESMLAHGQLPQKEELEAPVITEPLTRTEGSQEKKE